MNRIPSLDGLRAISILLVLADHMAYAAGRQNIIWDTLGHAGVIVFFVISGYLITSIMMRESEFSVKAFWERRAWRILPPVIAYLTIVTALGYETMRGRDLALAWGYLASYASFFGKFPWDLSHLWSLSVEEQFYLLWPLAFAFSNPKRWAWAAVALAPIVRYSLNHAGYYQPAMFAFPAVFDAIAIGCLMALYGSRLKTWRYGWVWWLIAAPAPFLSNLGHVHGYFHVPQLLGHASWSIFAFSVAGGVWWAIAHKPWILNNWLMVRIGLLSYALYLWQMPWMNPDWQIPTWYRLLGTVVCAIGSYYLIELPALKVRHWTKRRLQCVPTL